MKIFGYVRVSSKDQNEERQMIALHSFGVEDKNIFVDKQSGKDFVRPEYLRMVNLFQKGDLLIIKSIDRLGRNYNEILEQWRILTKEKEIDIVVLDMPLLDTRKNRDLIGTLIADIVLQLLSYVAQTERDFIKQRQAEGIAAAKARGVHFGRLPSTRPEDYSYCVAQWGEGNMSARQAGKLLGVAHTTFLTWLRKDGYFKDVRTHNSKSCNK